VIVSAGGPDGQSLIAYHAADGSVLWSAGDAQVSYASPVLATLCGVEQVVMLNEASVAGHRLSDGEILWTYPWPGSSNGDASVSQPVAVGGDRLFLSKGYGTGSALVQLATAEQGGFSTETVWQNSIVMKTKMTNAVLHDGSIYGLSGGILECIDAGTGRRQWKRGRYDHGQILRLGDLLLVVAEDGRVVAVDLSPEEHRQRGEFQALEGKTWNNPALAGGRYLLLRNHRQAACYELPLRGE